MIQLIIEETLDLITYLIKNYKDGNNKVELFCFRIALFSIFPNLLKNIQVSFLNKQNLNGTNSIFKIEKMWY